MVQVKLEINMNDDVKDVNVSITLNSTENAHIINLEISRQDDTNKPSSNNNDWGPGHRLGRAIGRPRNLCQCISCRIITSNSVAKHSLKR